jgi:protein arginine N-methyltransferase 1
MKKDDVNFSSAYSLKIIRNDKLHGLVSWFDCIFEDPKQPQKRVVLTTGTGSHGTHWKQTTFYMDMTD